MRRVSATEWLEDVYPNEPSWQSEDTVKFAAILAEHGVDLVDVSTSGSSPKARISLLNSGQGYQVPFAAAVKQAHGDKILVSAVGAIRDGKFAQSILDEVRASLGVLSDCSALTDAGTLGQSGCGIRGTALPEEPRASVVLCGRPRRRAASFAPDRVGVQGAAEAAGEEEWIRLGPVRGVLAIA